MLTAINQIVERLIFERAGFDPAEVEVRFEQPTQQWVDSRLRPTINFFLFDLEEHLDLRSTARQTTVANGRVAQRLAPRRFNLRYMVTAWSREPSDEHTLIWRTLATLLKYNPLPEELQPAGMATGGLQLHTRVGRYEEAPSLTELWNTLNLPLRPGLLYTVIAPLDLELTLEAPAVLQRSLQFRLGAEPRDEAPLGGAGGPLDREWVRIAGVVRAGGAPIAGAVVALEGSAEQAVTDSQGRYSLLLRRAESARLLVSAPGYQPHTLSVDPAAAVFDIDLG